VSLLRDECELPKLSPQSDLGRRADSRWALPQIFSSHSVFMVIYADLFHLGGQRILAAK